MYFVAKFFSFNTMERVNFYKLAFFPFWLIVRIYYDAVFMVKMILTDSKCGIETEKLYIANESLRIVLEDSITLTPGSIFMGIEGDDITLLCIGSKKHEGFPVTKKGLRAIERILLKCCLDERKK